MYLFTTYGSLATDYLGICWDKSEIKGEAVWRDVRVLGFMNDE